MSSEESENREQDATEPSAERYAALEALLGGAPPGEPEIDEAEATEPSPEMRAAFAALLEEPFPEKPFTLVVKGTERDHEGAEFVIHKDIASEHQCVFVFDSIVDAFQVAEEYKAATGREAEPIEVDVHALDEDRFYVKFYRANGVIAILSLSDYKKNLGPRPD